ncbi:E3 ubiquitin ligase TRAF3IP2 isoform X2 [Pristis pectinata]|uniref:E3 ubiquitin ligase TRAF3IP2 isoform X2 n=1 Tax=Pristis pectinata TaxID=685728 RepID=UPI00223E4C93|nr:E3 ubiquitin ligase TRAF3IP2 isoform X2 [Pristis pectinata]XP_051870756.1 E3 ubiquitin ligase TRAF3IP2 isoform X2 [Pristis pectinata]XP_051870757.1 E3 ubiquitin ligase TRAF3IP2 isoform X2 [Pristis pectinata]
MLKSCPQSSQECANSSQNRPEENDETDSESSLSKSQITSFDLYGAVPGNCCSSDHFRHLSQSPACSDTFSKGIDSTCAGAPFHHVNNCCSSSAGHVGNWHGPSAAILMGDYSFVSDDNLSPSASMTNSPQNGSTPPSMVSSYGTLGLTHLEPGLPLRSYQVQPPSPFLQQSPCRPGVSVYVPEPRRFPPVPPGRVDHNPFGTPGFIPPNGPGNFSLQRPLAPTDPVNTNVPLSVPLPREQRKVFVTYATDNDKHVGEVINFVALLIRNGFETQIDIFEQQFRSINKIDWMERYINDKGYLIIIIISPKYYEAVTSQNFDIKNDEHSLNSVFIYKQLQNEFIQNGSKNFRFVPIIFPGACMKHVPSWLQNTHVYNWPVQSQDILRRLMRLEKYNPPPVGELPTIIQKSI